MKVTDEADLNAHVLHSNVVPLSWLRLSARLVARLILLQPVSHGLGRLHHVLQLVWVWRRVALQVSLLEENNRHTSKDHKLFQPLKCLDFLLILRSVLIGCMMDSAPPDHKVV